MPCSFAVASRTVLSNWDDALSKVDFPVYGLGPAWTGERSVAGFSDDGRGALIAGELLHGDLDVSGGPAVTVQTMRVMEERPSPEVLAEDMLEDELHTLLSGPGPREWAHEAQIVRRVRGASRRSVPIRVDGQFVQFRVLERDDVWGAGAAINDLDVSLSGHGLDPAEIELRTVDLADYQSARKR